MSPREPIPVAEWLARLTTKPARAAAVRPPALRGAPTVTCGPSSLVALLPLEAPLPALVNAHVHWRARAGVTKGLRALVALTLGRYRRQLRELGLPLAVTLTRVGRQRLDSDNVHSAVKAARDELAALLGLPSDAGDEVTWLVEQETGAPALRIDVTRRVDAAEEG